MLTITLLQSMQRAWQLLEVPMNVNNSREIRAQAQYFLLTPRIPARNRLPPDACVRLGNCMIFFCDFFDASGIPFTPLHLTVGLSYGIREQVKFLKLNNRLPTLQEFIDELVVFRETQLPFQVRAFSDFFSFILTIEPTRAAFFNLFITFIAQRHPINFNQLVIRNNAALLQHPSLALLPINLVNIAQAFLVDVERVDIGFGRIGAAIWIEQHAIIINALIKIRQQCFFDGLQH